MAPLLLGLWGKGLRQERTMSERYRKALVVAAAAMPNGTALAHHEAFKASRTREPAKLTRR
jgi:hypothetical protein